MRTGSTQQTRHTAVAPAADHRLCVEQAVAGLLLPPCGMYVGHASSRLLSQPNDCLIRKRSDAMLRLLHSLTCDCKNLFCIAGKEGSSPQACSNDANCFKDLPPP